MTPIWLGAAGSCTGALCLYASHQDKHGACSSQIASRLWSNTSRAVTALLRLELDYYVNVVRTLDHLPTPTKPWIFPSCVQRTTISKLG